jgi:hypothetical protein
LRHRDLLVDFKNDFNAMLEHLEQQGYVLIRPAKPTVNAETLQTVGGMSLATDHSEVTPDHPGAQRP